MDPQVPTTPIEEPGTYQIPDPKIPADNHWITILAMGLFVIASLAIVAFLYYQNQQLKTMLASYQAQTVYTPTPIPTSEATIEASPSASPKSTISPTPSSVPKLSSPTPLY